ncbi:hypothetical protein RB595_007101 [Gaeumannomyces hyphopodioides]
MDNPPDYPHHQQHEQIHDAQPLIPPNSSTAGRPLSRAGSPGNTGTDADTATVILVPRRALQPISGRGEVLKLAFSPNGEWILGLAGPKQDGSQFSYVERAPKSLYAWRAHKIMDLANPDDFANNFDGHANRKPYLASDLAFAPTHPGSAAVSIACPTWHSNDEHLEPRLNIYRVTPGPPSATFARATWVPLPISEPIVWSPDGKLIAAASTNNPSRVCLVAVTPTKPPQLLRVLPNFSGRLTHLAFVPRVGGSEAGGGFALASASLDGVVRITDVETGQTLRKFEMAVAGPPHHHHHEGAGLFRASADGGVIASIWGREVMLWYPATGEARVYSLGAARLTEGWPLDISPDCRYLACRTEVGFDVSDLATGRFMGEARVDDSSFFAAAAFSWNSKLMAVGKNTGEMYVYDVNVVNCAV